MLRTCASRRATPGAVRYRGNMDVPANRRLVVIADDFGIGSATSQGILDLAEAGVISGTVLLVNSPHAEADVAQWRKRGTPVPLGWHPCLTLDRPVLPTRKVKSLVNTD